MRPTSSRSPAPAPGGRMPHHGCRALLLFAAVVALAAVTTVAAAAGGDTKPVCQPGDLGVSVAGDCTAVLCAAQLAAPGLGSEPGAQPTTYQGSGGLCCKCSFQAKGSSVAAPAPSPAGTAPHEAEEFWTQEDRPAAGPIVDAPAIPAAPAPAPFASEDDDALAKAVLLLREVWSPMSDAQIPIVMGTLAALTKDATWTYRAQQPAAPSFQLQLPPQEEGEQWWVETDPEQVPPKDTQGVVLFVETELPRVRAAMASATLVHASETGQLTRALRDAGLQTKAVDVLFAGSGPVILNTTLLPSASPGASNAGESNSSSADTQGSGSGSGSGSEEGGGSSLSAGAIAALCISCVALVAAVAGTILHVRRRRARQGRYEVFEEGQRSGSSPMSGGSSADKPYSIQAW